MRLIDADELSKNIYDNVSALYVDAVVAKEDCLRKIEEAPTVDAVPVVHGIWIPVYESEMSGWDPAVAGFDPIGGYICSACKDEAVYDCNDKFVLSDYCPNCGAKMNKGDKDDA